jgi:ribosome recycling factor
MEDFETELKQCVDYTLSEFTNVRTGRVSPTIAERITVEYYGTPTILRDLATITNEDARTLLINPWDISIRAEVCKALASANIGANPIDNGQYIRMIFPLLTEERRKELVKQVRVMTENCRVAIRNKRRDILDKIKKTAKTESIGEDDVKMVETDVQKIVDSYISNIETFLNKKESDIMTV